MNNTKRTVSGHKFFEFSKVSTLLFTLIIIFEIFSLINPNFFSSYNFVSMVQSAAPYIILSLGALFPIALGSVDLSAGALLIASAVVAGKLYSLGMPLWGVIPVMIAVGTVVGMLNGKLVSKLKLPPFIVTLGTMMFIRGLSALFANQPNILFPTDSWYNSVFSVADGFPVGIFWVIGIAFAVGWYFKKTRTGRYILAVGCNEKTSIIAGINTKQIKFRAFTASGLLTGVAAVLWSASFATVNVASGVGMELDAIAGAYIGGSAAAGGSVNVTGAVIGALLLVVIRNGLNFVLAKLNITVNSTYVTYVITGIIVVAAVFLDKKKQKQDRQRSLSGNTTEKFSFRKFIFPCIAVVLAVIMIFTGSFNSVNPVNAENRTIAVLSKSEDSAFWESVKKGAQDAADEYGCRLLFRGPQSQDASQLPVQRELMSVMLSENPAGLGIATIADGFTDLLEEAYDRNVTVIQYDSGLYDTDEKTIMQSEKNPLAGNVIGDNYANAALLAEAAFEKVYNDILLSDQYIVGIIQHEDTPIMAERTDGFSDRFMQLAESDPDTAGKCAVYCEVKPSEKNNAYRDGLEALYEKGASLIYTTAEIAVNQVYDAVCAAGNKYNGMSFATYDSGQKVIEWMKSDSEAKFICGISQNPYRLGYLTVETLVRIAEGEKVENEIIVPGVVYDSENCDELIQKNIIS